MIFDGFETVSIAPCCHDGHGLNLSSGRIQEIAPAATLALDPEQIKSSQDGKLNPITGATDSSALEPHTDSTAYDIRISGTPDSSPAIGSEPCESADTELDRLSIFKFSAADVFQHSPTGDVLNSLKSLSLAGDAWPNYVRFELTTDDGEFCFPPATTS